MLLQLLAAQPQMLGTVVANTPRLIWGLLGRCGSLHAGADRAMAGTARHPLRRRIPELPLPGSWLPLLRDPCSGGTQ